MISWTLILGFVRAEVMLAPVTPGLEASPHYRVEVRDHDGWRGVFVHRSVAQRPESNSHPEAAWVSFSFSGSVKVRVTKTAAPPPLSGVVLPSSKQIAATVKDHRLEFELKQPGQFSVEMDGDVTIPLLVFADPPETDIPDRAAEGVIWFDPGIHHLPDGILHVADDQTVYLSPGAVVYGRISGKGHRIRILGRGILSGEHLTWAEESDRHKMDLCKLDWSSDDAVIDGPTLVGSPYYILTLHGAGARVRNTKLIGWRFNNDGIITGTGGLVEDCFLMCNDDALKLYFSGTTVRRCTVWQLENGAPFQISWNMPSDNSGFTVSDCDVIRCEHRWKNQNTAVFCAIHGGKGSMTDYLFENIRIENTPFRLWNITVQPNEFADPSDHPGPLKNLVFRRITAASATSMPNTFKGHTPRGGIEGVTFDNVRVGGVEVTGPGVAGLELDAATVTGVRFLPGP